MITTREIAFIFKNTKPTRLLSSVASFDHPYVSVLKAIGKEGLVKLFNDSNSGDFKLYEKYIGRGPSRTYLDIGCGSGDMSHWIHKATGVKTIGFDVTEKAFSSESRSKLSSDYSFIHAAPGEPLPLKDQTVDVATMFYVLHHCNPGNGDRRQALGLLKEAKRVIKDGGWLIIMEEPIRSEYERSYKDKMDAYANGLFYSGAVDKSHFYYEPELLKQFQDAGSHLPDIQVIKIKAWGWLLPRTLYIVPIKH